MPPKKKGKKKKEKPLVKLGSAGGLTVDDKYKETLKRIETLQDHLSLRNEIASRAHQTSKVLHNELMTANAHVEKERQNTHDITANLKREHVAKETELTRVLATTKTDFQIVQEKLAHTEKELKRVTEDRDRIMKEKDEIIASLEFKIENMESEYEKILHDAFDDLTVRISDLRPSWKQQMIDIQSRNKELLMEFGLHPLHI